MPTKTVTSLGDLAALTQAEFVRIDRKMDGGFLAMNNTLRAVLDILDLMRAEHP